MCFQKRGEDVADEADVLAPDGPGLDVTGAVLLDQAGQTARCVYFCCFGEPDFGLRFLAVGVWGADGLRHGGLAGWNLLGARDETGNDDQLIAGLSDLGELHACSTSRYLF